MTDTLNSIVKATMASSLDILCGICDRQQIAKHAIKWCPECDEGLCSECEKYHRVSKSSRHHKVISTNEYKMLPTNVSNIEHYCQEHQREFKHYCPQHNKLCCALCISKIHNNCTGFMALEDIAKDAKTSTLLNNIEQSLHDTRVNIEQILQDREQNLAKIKEQRQQFHDEIKQIRCKINAHLDEIEKQTLGELDTAEKSLQSKMDDLLGQLKAREKAVEDLKKNITDVKSYASDLQAYFGIKQLEKSTDQEVQYVMSMADDERLQQIDLKCVINEKIADILTIPTCGSVTIEKGKTTVALRTEKDKEAQIISVVPVPHRDINTITLKFIPKFDIPRGHKEKCVTGCAILPNGNLVIADCDYNNRIVITNDHGVLQSEISVSPSRPFDVTCPNDSLIGFSSLESSKIDILHTASETITESITTSGHCDGITNRQGTIIYCERGKGFQQIQPDTKSLHSIVQQEIPKMTYVTTNETKIYHTNFASRTVTCYNLTGDKIWEFIDASILETPFGIAVDKHSNIYLASKGNNCIFVMSSDGQKFRLLWKEETDECKYPRGLAIDKETGNLLVACYNGKILLYEICYA